MPSGIQIFNGSGSIVFDTNDRAGKIVGILNTTAPASGSVVLSGMGEGIPFFMCVNNQGTYGGPLLVWNASNSTLTWSFTPGDASLPSETYTVYYGVY